MKIPGSIRLKDLNFYAYHGWYEEERKTGGRYLMDIEVETLFHFRSGEMKLEDTINYELIYSLAEKHMNQSRRLLEEVVIALGNDLRDQFESINNVRICLKKLDVPLGKHAGSAEVEMMF